MVQGYPQISKWVTFFLFPFRFFVEGRDALLGALRKSTDRWQESPLHDQQESNYFLPYTRDFLRSEVSHFVFQLPEKQPRSLKVSGYDELFPELVAIQLHLFPLGIGILSLEVKGKSALSFDKLLNFNEVFRYPIKAHRDHNLPQISLQIGPKQIPEDIHSCQGLAPLVCHFLQDGKEALEPLPLNERLLVYSYAALDRNSLGQDYNLDDLFFKFLFVDRADDPLPDADFRRELLDIHEYRRWRSYVYSDSPQSIRFGFSRSTGVVMGLESWFFNELVFQHFRTMYYDMALILLFHRTALLKLSSGISAIKFTEPRERRDKIRRVREHVLEFTNRYWFGEITNPDQGLEMFDHWKKVLRNQALFDEVPAKLREDDDLRNLHTERLNNTFTVLTAGTYLFLPLALTAYYLAVPKLTSLLTILALFFFAVSFAFAFLITVRFSTAMWELLQDVSTGQPIKVVMRKHWQKLTRYVRQAYKRLKSWKPL